MPTYSEFIEAYSKKNAEELKKIKTCSHKDCNEQDVSFIDASNRLDVQFYCLKHWKPTQSKPRDALDFLDAI